MSGNQHSYSKAVKRGQYRPMGASVGQGRYGVRATGNNENSSGTFNGCHSQPVPGSQTRAPKPPVQRNSDPRNVPQNHMSSSFNTPISNQGQNSAGFHQQVPIRPLMNQNNVGGQLQSVHTSNLAQMPQNAFQQLPQVNQNPMPSYQQLPQQATPPVNAADPSHLVNVFAQTMLMQQQLLQSMQGAPLQLANPGGGLLNTFMNGATHVYPNHHMLPPNPVTNAQFDNPAVAALFSGQSLPVGVPQRPVLPNSTPHQSHFTVASVEERMRMMEDVKYQEAHSMYKLKFVYDESRFPSCSVAWESSLVYLFKKESPSTKKWRFSIRCKKNVFLSQVSLDQLERRDFKIGNVKVHEASEDSENAEDVLEGEINKDEEHWDCGGKKLKAVVVEVVFEPPSQLIKLPKFEVRVQFHLSNGVLVDKIIQVVRAPEDFNVSDHERDSIEAYQAPRIGRHKKRVFQSKDIRMDDWTKQFDSKYKVDEEDLSVPEVTKTTADSYKKDLHSALYHEEIARAGALKDLSLQANVDFVTFYKNGEDQPIRAASESVFAIFKCPFTVSEDSVRGEALSEVAAYAVLSRRGDWDKSSASIECISGKICDRFVKVECETFSTLELKKDFKNFYIVLKINKEELESQKFEIGRSEFMYVEFLLDRRSFIHCHYSVDQIKDTSVFFPTEKELSDEEKPPWYYPATSENIYKENQRKLAYNLEFRDRYMLCDLNYDQQEACEACWYKVPKKHIPPILITGPFGTGKTYTLATATENIINDYKEARILVCIVSRNTGNAYHRRLVDKDLGSKCYRIFSEDDDLSAVDDDLIQYSNYDLDPLQFRMPDPEKVKSSNAVIVTLSAAVLLRQLGFTNENFTHVFIDEAAQVAEFFLVPVLSFATRKRKLCLTGDVMQLNPVLYSTALSRNFGHSIVQRFSMLVYKVKCGYSFTLDVNYRSQVGILDFVYKHFYKREYNDLSKDKCEKPFPGLPHPLLFVAVRGKMTPHQSLASNCNWIEANKVVETVQQVMKDAPAGYLVDHGIGVVTCYQGQVQAIKDALWEAGVEVCGSLLDVDTVRNIQGRQYRVLIVSTVIDIKSISDAVADPSKRHNDMGFLSDIKLVCTAMTRAISAVIVIGDPAALVVDNRYECYSTWREYVELTMKKGSMFNEQPDNLVGRVKDITNAIHERLARMRNAPSHSAKSDLTLMREVSHQMNSLQP